MIISPRKSQISFIEVSHPIEAGMTTYPGLPKPKAEIFRKYSVNPVVKNKTTL